MRRRLFENQLSHETLLPIQTVQLWWLDCQSYPSVMEWLSPEWCGGIERFRPSNRKWVLVSNVPPSNVERLYQIVWTKFVINRDLSATNEFPMASFETSADVYCKTTYRTFGMDSCRSKGLSPHPKIIIIYQEIFRSFIIASWGELPPETKDAGFSRVIRERAFEVTKDDVGCLFAKHRFLPNDRHLSLDLSTQSLA